MHTGAQDVLLLVHSYLSVAVFVFIDVIALLIVGERRGIEDSQFGKGGRELGATSNKIEMTNTNSSLEYTNNISQTDKLAN